KESAQFECVIQTMEKLGLAALGRVVTGRVFICSRKEVRTMTIVNLRPNESQDSLLKRFRKKVVKSGVLSTVRRKRWFISKSEQRRMERKKAMRRLKRRQVVQEE
ncbi:MAG: 30S ribosomal protein S21, partial [Anaerolineales bacterium]|nr:30S ribosomal protein S21 [Anaerolineales bacterium]